MYVHTYVHRSTTLTVSFKVLQQGLQLLLHCPPEESFVPLQQGLIYRGVDGGTGHRTSQPVLKQENDSKANLCAQSTNLDLLHKHTYVCIVLCIDTHTPPPPPHTHTKHTHTYVHKIYKNKTHTHTHNTHTHTYL